MSSSISVFVLFALFVRLQCVASTQSTPPQISETYSTLQTVVNLITLQSENQLVYRNFVKGQQLIANTISNSNGTIVGWIDTIIRADLNRSFQYYLPYEFCVETSTGNVTIGKVWDWVANSTYKEQRIFDGQVVNVWSYEADSTYREVGVQLKDPSVPVFYFIANKEAQSAQRIEAKLITFEKFIDSVPAEDLNVFDIPQACMKRQ